jgi:RNA polymerase sigma-70 factor, ECF subfamily
VTNVRLSRRAAIEAPDELLQAYLRTRSEDSFAALYRAHAPAMFALATHLLLPASDADDVLQEAWVRAIRAIDRFRGDSSLRTWLCGFVVNCCRERLRVPRWDEVPDLPVETTDRVSVLDVRSALGMLPPGYRAVLILHDVYGYTHREIAEALNVEEGTSKSQLFHARRSMRARLRGPFPKEPSHDRT